MNISQLTEAVAQGANPLAVIEAAIREGVRPLRVREASDTYWLGQIAAKHGYSPMSHDEYAKKSSDGYYSSWHHMTKELDDGARQHAASGNRSPFSYASAHLNPEKPVAIFGANKDSKSYNDGPDGLGMGNFHAIHVYADGGWSHEGPEGEIASHRQKKSLDQHLSDEHTLGESVVEGKPSGISRAWDQPGRSAVQKARFDKDAEYYNSERGLSVYGPSQAAAHAAKGPEIDYKTDHDRTKFLGRYSSGSRIPSGAADKAAKKSYGNLPPVLQRLVKKNVRATAAEPKGSGYNKGPLAGKTGYQAYDIKHQASAAVGFDPAPAFKHLVGAGHTIDPAMNQRSKDHDSFKSALYQLGRSQGAKHGVQNGKQVKTGGYSRYSAEYSHITHVHHPEHGEIQLFSPDNSKKEPTVYHRPAGAARGKMHAWSSPEAQAVVGRVMSSGHES